MSDRELLELAAKAAGIEGSCDSSSALRYADESGKITYWNPLDDDGDALRLAVNLGFRLDTAQMMHWGLCSAVTGDYWDRNGFTGNGAEQHHQDKYAATRRAIVRAAAEIGRNMP